MVKIPGTDRAIAVTLDCAEWHTEISPREGGQASVLEAARNVACTGALPIAATDCLNYANPEKGSTGWRLAQSIAGMAEALTVLDAPIVSGNVSLYNESPRGPIFPTPVVGIVGLLDDASKSVGAAWAQTHSHRWAESVSFFTPAAGNAPVSSEKALCAIFRVHPDAPHTWSAESVLKTLLASF